MMTIDSLEKKLKASGRDKVYQIETDSKRDILVLVNEAKEREKRYFVAMYDFCDGYLYVSDALSAKEKNFLFDLIDENEWDEWTMKVVSDCTETGKYFEGYDGYDYTGEEYDGCGFCYDCYESEHGEPWYQAELDATRIEQAIEAKCHREEVKRLRDEIKRFNRE